MGSRGRRKLLTAGILSCVAWVLLQLVAPPTRIPWSPEMLFAAGRMAEGIERTGAYCRERGIPVDRIRDPSGSCLIGPDYTPLVTSLGQLEAKRTTVNPDVAGLLVHLLSQVGVSEGDTVAIGASGSFPGFLLATLVAVEALGAEPVTILSLGASSYGATRPDLHLLDLHDLWRGEGILESRVGALSLGGADDVGGEFEEELRDGLIQQIQADGISLIDEPVLPSNVAQRVNRYGDAVVFVNVGGAQANMGTSPRVLGVPPGLSMVLEPPPPEERGVLFEMAARGVPVIHLLHVRGLALKHGLPWDPIPLPAPGATLLQTGERAGGLPFWLLTGGYLSSLILLLLAPMTVRRPPQ
jgi:poly-gamma-glutamate system protein